jgi:hypothetical protein
VLGLVRTAYSTLSTAIVTRSEGRKRRTLEAKAEADALAKASAAIAEAFGESVQVAAYLVGAAKEASYADAKAIERAADATATAGLLALVESVIAEDSTLAAMPNVPDADRLVLGYGVEYLAGVGYSEAAKDRREAARVAKEAAKATA